MSNPDKTSEMSGGLYLPTTRHAQSLTDKQSGSLIIPLLVLLTICFLAPAAQAKYGGGTGEPNDPYLIYDANQMNTIGIGANLPDWEKHFILMADIDLSGYTGTAFNIIPNFSGVFDGNGFTISNFTYASVDTAYIALFGYVSGANAEIKNLGLIDPNIDAGPREYVGSLVGQLTSGTITNCYVRGGSVSGAMNVGGLVGYSDGTITSSYAGARVSGQQSVGGLVGNNGSTITNCYAEGGSVSGNQVVGGLVGLSDGWSRAGTITNCYSTTSVSGAQFFGGLIGYNWEGEVINCFWDIDTSGQSTSAGGTPKTTAELQTIGTFAAWACSPVWTIDEGNDYPRLAWQNLPGETLAGQLLGGGSGTQADPYLIYTSEHLNTIGLMSCLWERNFKLMADIDLAGFNETSFNMIGTEDIPFSGVFDGNGHTISNFSYTSIDASYIGLFGCLDGPDAVIKDLGLIAPNVDGGTETWGVGPLVGYVKSGTITGCYAKGGSVSGTMEVSEAAVLLDYDVNPIYANLRNISNTGTAVLLSDDQVSSPIPLPFNFIFYGTEVSEVYISSNGFITFLSGQSQGCCSGQQLPDPFTPNGLIAGFWNDLDPSSGGTIRYQTLGPIGSRQFVIGFYAVPHCCSTNYYPVTFEIILHEGTSNIELQYGSAPSHGGIHSAGIENFDGTDGLQVAFGNVSFTYEGFLISVERNVGVGGLLGYNGGAVTNCYTEGGSASEGSAVGGLVGWNYGVIANSYSTGSTSGEQSVGGLVGDNLGTVLSSFWDIETSGQPTGDGGTGLPTAEMQMASTFIAWGCDSVWTIDDGNDYPRLVWENMPGELISKPSYGGGTGTQADPYLIYTAEQLNMIGLFLCDLDKHFMLMADIDLSAYTASSFNIIGNEMTAFTGTFDGNDHTISNFSYTSTGRSHTGLFGYVDGPDAEIKNLQLLAPNVNAGTADYAGALVGWLGDGTITNCYVQGGSVAGGSRVGGLAGENEGIITNSYASSTVEGNVDVGGLVGYNMSDPTVYLYTADTISSDLRNIRTTGTAVLLGGDDVSGAIPLPFSFSFYGTDVSQVFISSNGFITFVGDLNPGCCSGQELPDPMYPNGLIAGFWNDLYPAAGTIRYQTLGPEGSRQFVVGFYAVPHCCTANFYPVTFEIILHEGTNNIELQYGSAPSQGGIHSVGIENLQGNDGLLVAYGDVSFNNEGFLITSGGMVEKTGGIISSCHSTGNVSGTTNVGGLIGNNESGIVTDCQSDSRVLGTTNVGGLVGYNTWGIITDCYATGEVTGSEMMIGGLMGLNEWGTITNCYATGSVSQTGDFGIVGGLMGYNVMGTVTNSYATGSVSGLIYVGGLAGANGGTMSFCYSQGGSASGDQCVGGLVGYNMEIISNSYSNYSVSGNLYVGGLAGWNVYGTITNSYANGSAFGNQYVGGLVGQNGYSEGGNYMPGMISKCYSTGSVGGTGLTVGGLVGDHANGAVSASFWDVQTSGSSNSDGGTGLPTAEMQMMSTFTDAAWDFTTPVWTIEEGNDYPRFWWEIVPVLHAEPEITLGTNNTISWDPIPGANDYYAECAEDANFTSIAYSASCTETSYKFTGLQSGKHYWYSVKARNIAGLETNWSNVESSLQVTLADAVELLLDLRSLKNRNMKNALLNKINALQKMIAEGLYEEALDKLRNDLLQKTDGCVLTGEPDKNDWIKTCKAQSLIYPLIIETIENVIALMEQSPDWLRTPTTSSSDTRSVTVPLNRRALR